MQHTKVFKRNGTSNSLANVNDIKIVNMININLGPAGHLAHDKFIIAFTQVCAHSTEI